MTKRFFEAFPTLELNKSLAECFLDVDVDRITVNRNGDTMRIYLDSAFLLKYKDLRISH